MGLPQSAFTEFYGKANRFLDEERKTEARVFLLKAARELYKEAGIKNGEERKHTVAQAERLSQMAAKLEGKKTLNSTGSCSGTENAILAEENGKKWRVSTPNVRFEDIAGLHEAKDIIMNKGILPLRFPEETKRYKKRIGGGLILHGPPGTGKTMLGKAVATELKVPFFSVLSSSLMSKWVGDAEKNIKELFDAARQHPLSVIYIDETEALVPRRGGGSTIMARVVPEFLAQIDGVETQKNAILLLGATNFPWKIDDAALRPGRFDACIYVGLPDFEARETLITRQLATIPQEDDLDIASLAFSTEGLTGADIMNLIERAKEYPWRREIESKQKSRLTMEDLQLAQKNQTFSVTPKMLKPHHKFMQERGGLT